MEEDICFTVMLSFVSCDPSFQIWRTIVGCPVLKLPSVHLCVSKGKKGHLFGASSNDNTLATIVQLSTAVTNKCKSLHEKRGKNLFSGLKSLQLALRAVILSWIHRLLPKSLN